MKKFRTKVSYIQSNLQQKQQQNYSWNTPKIIKHLICRSGVWTNKFRKKHFYRNFGPKKLILNNIWLLKLHKSTGVPP